MWSHNDDSVNRPNYKSEHHLLCSALTTAAAAAAVDKEDDANISADVAEYTDWKTGPV